MKLRKFLLIACSIILVTILIEHSADGLSSKHQKKIVKAKRDGKVSISISQIHSNPENPAHPAYPITRRRVVKKISKPRINLHIIKSKLLKARPKKKLARLKKINKLVHSIKIKKLISGKYDKKITMSPVAALTLLAAMNSAPISTNPAEPITSAPVPITNEVNLPELTLDFNLVNDEAITSNGLVSSDEIATVSATQDTKPSSAPKMLTDSTVHSVELSPTVSITEENSISDETGNTKTSPEEGDEATEGSKDSNESTPATSPSEEASESSEVSKGTTETVSVSEEGIEISEERENVTEGSSASAERSEGQESSEATPVSANNASGESNDVSNASFSDESDEVPKNSNESEANSDEDASITSDESESDESATIPAVNVTISKGINATDDEDDENNSDASKDLVPELNKSISIEVDKDGDDYSSTDEIIEQMLKNEDTNADDAPSLDVNKNVKIDVNEDTGRAESNSTTNVDTSEDVPGSIDIEKSINIHETSDDGKNETVTIPAPQEYQNNSIGGRRQHRDFRETYFLLM